jgi:uncharacterized protein
VTALLDANVLIAMVVIEHVHHDAATEWLSESDTGFATCPTAEGSLVRFLVRTGQSAATARDVVSAVENAKRHEFWPGSGRCLPCSAGTNPQRAVGDSR